MKRIITASTLLISSALVSACGGGGGGDSTGSSSDNTGIGGGSTGRSVTVADYLIPSESVEFSIRELEYVNGELLSDIVFTQTDDVSGNLLISTEDIEGTIQTSMIQLIGDEVILSSTDDDTTLAFPSQVNINQSVTTFFDTASLAAEINIPADEIEGTVMSVFTFAAVHDSFSLTAPDQVGPTYSDVLQIDLAVIVDLEIVSADPAINGIELNLNDHSSAYFSRDLGFVGDIDRNCIVEIEGQPAGMDDSLGFGDACGSVDELYEIRLN